MRFSILVISLVSLGACDRKPDFDERYRDQAAALHNSANSMEREAASQIRNADMAERAIAPANNEGVTP